MDDISVNMLIMFSYWLHYIQLVKQLPVRELVCYYVLGGSGGSYCEETGSVVVVVAYEAWSEYGHFQKGSCRITSKGCLVVE